MGHESVIWTPDFCIYVIVNKLVSLACNCWFPWWNIRISYLFSLFYSDVKVKKNYQSYNTWQDAVELWLLFVRMRSSRFTYSCHRVGYCLALACYCNLISFRFFLLGVFRCKLLEIILEFQGSNQSQSMVVRYPVFLHAVVFCAHKS